MKTSWALRRILSILFLFMLFIFISAHSHDHGHSHDHHHHDGLHAHDHHHHHDGLHAHDHHHHHEESHSHEHHHHEKPSFKYSQRANEQFSETKETFPKKPHKPKNEAYISLWLQGMGSTFLISIFPFFILFFIPIHKRDEHQNLLKILLSFASGGLLGDAFLHLIPHALLAHSLTDENSHSHSHSHSHFKSKDNEESEMHGHDLSVGLGVLGGILVFLMVEKFVRIVKGGHGHSHSHAPKDTKSKEVSSEVKGKDSKNKDDTCKEEDSDNSDQIKKVSNINPGEQKQEKEDIMVAGYLNLAADFMHNFTDGLAIGASYLTGPSIGVVTTVTILLHEIPHEIGDFAILIQSGCTKRKAIMLQLLTAIGALTGTAFSLFFGGLNAAATNLILPFTAGGFIYIATVSVIPDLLEETNFWQSVKEVIALIVGVYMMVLIASYE